MEQPRTGATRPSRLGADLAVLVVVGVFLVAALGAGGLSLYQQFYGPSAFVESYLSLLSSGRAADALRVPGVAVDRDTLKEAGINASASEALLRQAALAPLEDVKVLSEELTEDDVYHVTVQYTTARGSGKTTYNIVRDGWIGVVPNWRFETSPLASVELSVFGADSFAVNGFEIDRRQVSADGVEADPLAPVELLVFTPGLYSVTVDTAISASPGVSILADRPLALTPVEVQTQPTEKFIEVVQTRVEEFLTECTAQEVLLPTGCPFGLEIQDRIIPPPAWSIAKQPVVTVVPDGSGWAIPATDAVAHIEVDVRSLFDGRIAHVSEDVPFQVNGTIVILADGSASIRIGSPDSS